MSQFTVHFDTDNAAFEESPEAEISGILSEILDDVRDWETSGVCRDSYGNVVGGWTWNQ